MTRQPPPALFAEARKSFHAALLKSVLTTSNGIPTNADGNNRTSVEIARGILGALGAESRGARLAGQMSGNRFEEVTHGFLETTFHKLSHLRPGTWQILRLGGSRRRPSKPAAGRKHKASGISQFEQYAHLRDLEDAAAASRALAAALGSDYLITPDTVIVRLPEPDAILNTPIELVDAAIARMSSLREVNGGLPLLHASVSCKWTLRSDRAQNARSEALNLIRNRKGRLPHVVVVTGEPLPSRLASLALGTGDIDCVYHFALSELQASVGALPYPDAQDSLAIMVEGKRLKDIADLPLDLAV